MNAVRSGVLFSMALFLLMPAAAAGETSAENGVAVSSAAAGGSRELNAAIGDLNYKIELIHERYLQLNRDIDLLRAVDRDQKKIMNEYVLALPDPKRLENVEVELALIRSELAQAREDISLHGRKGEITASLPGEKKKLTLSSPWIAVSSLGLSFLALLIAL